MALFSSRSKNSTDPVSAARVAKDTTGRLANVLQAPWLSEKALLGSANGVYVFAVPAEANKLDVKAAVEKIYKVAPVKVRIANLPAKKVSLRTRRGQGSKARRHKAYVYLKKGDTIQF
jgi:large subunit ribosomal protein L23